MSPGDDYINDLIDERIGRKTEIHHHGIGTGCYGLMQLLFWVLLGLGITLLCVSDLRAWLGPRIDHIISYEGPDACEK